MQNATHPEFGEVFDTANTAHINTWQLILLTGATACLGFVINMMIDYHDERAAQCEKNYRLQECDPSQQENLMNFFRKIDAVSNSNSGVGGFCWRYRSELQAINGGAWSNLMYAYTKCVFLMLSGVISMDLAIFYMYASAAALCAVLVLWVTQKAMSGDQGNAVVLLVMNATQAIFGCYSTLVVFEDTRLKNTATVAFWTVGVVLIFFGICMALFVMDVSRVYVPLTQHENQIVMQELCRSFDLNMVSGDECSQPSINTNDPTQNTGDSKTVESHVDPVLNPHNSTLDEVAAVHYG